MGARFTVSLEHVTPVLSTVKQKYIVVYEKQQGAIDGVPPAIVFYTHFQTVQWMASLPCMAQGVVVSHTWALKA